METYGNTNVANSLHAIDTIVFKQKLVSLETLRDALLNDFRGYENLLEQCKGVAKYGNDNPQVDDVARRVHEHVCHTTRNQAKRARLHSYLVVIINNWANAVLGQFTGASAEGRHAGAPMANANNPTPGSDTSGVIPFLNSLIKLDPSLHAGATQNMKFTKEWFGPMRTKMDALLKTYFSRGGAQAMITVVDKKDLESAMENPAEWGHLMVRVGGFSIRFIDLPRISQLEVLARTLH